ncbi:hypothetical protein NDU88_008466 [Pleurodeles waltl]|uniref:Uncharacterized protein n=1 Tax=Pleurodeles waltl TaxID=8319 RepID=A0AAV7RVH7_PLEWA|nr:hypothetical protein NDU88_008466 [Pleurodeles waltl]
MVRRPEPGVGPPRAALAAGGRKGAPAPGAPRSYVGFTLAGARFAADSRARAGGEVKNTMGGGGCTAERRRGGATGTPRTMFIIDSCPPAALRALRARYADIQPLALVPRHDGFECEPPPRPRASCEPELWLAAAHRACLGIRCLSPSLCSCPQVKELQDPGSGRQARAGLIAEDVLYCNIHIAPHTQMRDAEAHSRTDSRVPCGCV